MEDQTNFQATLQTLQPEQWQLLASERGRQLNQITAAVSPSRRCATDTTDTPSSSINMRFVASFGSASEALSFKVCAETSA